VNRLTQILESKRVCVVCGAGGVGKTTSAASIGLAAARAGRRVLVITIDPSKRLAQTLGVSAHQDEPATLSLERLEAVGVRPPGSLSAWMLDPQAVCDRTVRNLAGSEANADRLLRNPVYQQLSSVVAGMQEYTAVEALHEFIRDDSYDLVVLDTPPSRDALRFLEAPEKARAFVDARILRLIVPGPGNRIRRAATRLVEGMLDLAFGAESRATLQQFFASIQGVLGYLNGNQAEMRRFFESDAAAFVLVSSPKPEALEEAFYFERRARELRLPRAGFVLNRSLAWTAGRALPSEAKLPAERVELAGQALAKLEVLAAPEAEAAARHAALRAELAERAGAGFAIAFPELPVGASDLESLVALAEQLEGLA